MIILPSNIRIFPVFLAVSTTDKPVNRNIHALPLKQLNVFALRGFIFRDIHKKQGRSSSNSGYRIQKICGWKIYSRTRTFGAEVHKSNIRVKKLAQQVWKWWIRLKDKFCFNDLLYKFVFQSNRTEIQTHKVEERTFRTPCTPSVKSTWGVSFQRTEDSRSAFSPFYSKGWKRYRGGGWVVIKFLVWIFLRPYFFRVNWRARIFFHFIFPCANIFFVLRPPPAPATHKFSNGPFVSFILQWTV